MEDQSQVFFFHLEIDLLMVDLLPEVTWQASLFAAGSLQSLIILLSQHLPDKRAGREHPGCPERLIQISLKKEEEGGSEGEGAPKKGKGERIKLAILFNACM